MDSPWKVDLTLKVDVTLSISGAPRAAVAEMD